MKLLSKLSFTLLLFSLFSCSIIAQIDTTVQSSDATETVATSSDNTEAAEIDDVFTGDEPDTGRIIDFYEGLLAALVFLWGFIARAFRIDKKVNDFVFVVIAGGIVLAGGFIYFGLASFLTSSLSILTAMGVFDLIKGGQRQIASKE